MTQTLEERAEELAKHCNNPVEALEHLRAVERAAYERSTKELYNEINKVSAWADHGYAIKEALNRVALRIRALAGGSDG